MKKLYFKAQGLALLMMASIYIYSCGDNKSTEETNQKVVSEVPANVEGLPNYRYVNYDTIMSKYNLAKDYQEVMMNKQQNMESVAKRHENSIQSLATTMQNKFQNSGYLTQESLQSDQDKLNNMQVNAQKELSALQADFQNAALTSEKAVNDSLKAFIKEYNMKKGYDAIFIKENLLYINPALDITSEVVEGLNARYNKVK